MVLWCDNCGMHGEHADGTDGEWRCRACGKSKPPGDPDTPPEAPPDALTSPGRRRMGDIGVGHGKWPADIPPPPEATPPEPLSSPGRRRMGDIGVGHGKW